MPMKKAAKAALKDDLTQRFNNSNAALVAEYRGLTVGQLTELRVALRAAKAEFRIIKNRVAKQSLKDGAENSAPLSPILKGPIGIVFAYGDAAAATKALLEFAKDKENFKVTGGVMEKRLLKGADLKEIADLPSREVMLGQIAGLLQNQTQGILNLITAIPRQVAQVLFNAAEKKQ